MSLSLSSRDRRTLTFGAVAVFGVLLLGRGVPAYRAWDRNVRASAVAVTTELARVRAAQRMLPVLRDSAAERTGRIAALSPLLVGGHTVSSASASLAGVLTGAAARSGVELGSVQFLPPDTASNRFFSLVRIHADATGDLTGLMGMLRILEQGTELLVVSNLAITQPDVGGPPDRSEALRMQLDVEALAAVRREPANTAAETPQPSGLRP